MATKKGNTKRRGASTAKSSKTKGGSEEIASAELGKHEAMIEQDETIKRLYAAITESVTIMSKRLHAGDDTREAATHFLICASNRFDSIAPPNYHAGLGYDHNASQIADNLRRVERNLSRVPIKDHLRIDHLLGDLVSEAIRLAQSQETFCEKCEHCLRKYPERRSYEMVTEDSIVDSETWAYILARFSDMSEDGTSALVVALKHIASMAWVSRPGAIRDSVNELVTALFKGSVNEPALADQFVSEQVASVKESIRWNKEEGKDA